MLNIEAKLENNRFTIILHPSFADKSLEYACYLYHDNAIMIKSPY